MQFPQLLPATLIRRYKRFLADIQLPDGKILTIHCAATGTMLGCSEFGIGIHKVIPVNTLILGNSLNCLTAN